MLGKGEERNVGYSVQGGEEFWVGGRIYMLGTLFREDSNVGSSVQGGEECWVRGRRELLGEGE